MKNHNENTLISSINDMLIKCKGCKNYNTRGGNFLSKNTYNIDVIFVAQNPGGSNYGQDVHPSVIVPFGLHTGFNGYNKFFKLFFEKFEEKYKREPVVYITNISKCVTKDNKLEDEEMINNCVSKYLLSELNFIQKINSKVKIVTLGSVARNAFTNIKELQSYQPEIMHHPGYMNRKGIAFIEESANSLVKKFEGII